MKPNMKTHQLIRLEPTPFLALPNPSATLIAPMVSKSTRTISKGRSETDRTFLNLFKSLRKYGLISKNLRVTRNVPPQRSKAAFRPDDLLTPSEAAAVLMLSIKTLANWRSRGCGPRFSKVGSEIRYRYSQVIEFSVVHSGNSTAEVQASRIAMGGRHA